MSLRAALAVGLVGDHNGDGFVSQSDLDLVLLNWGNGSPSSAAIPEPTTGGLIAAGARGIVFYRRKAGLGF